MKKYIVFAVIFVALFAVCFGIGIYMYKINNINEIEIEQITLTSQDKVTDECTEEYKQLQVLQANSKGEKVTPNATLILKKHYVECGHIIKDYINIPAELVNMDRNAIEQEYKDWEIENFAANEIVLKKEEEGICDEHYVLKEKGGAIEIYTVGRDNTETLKERTNILTMYLPEIDVINLRNGIRVNGREALNSTLQDYE